MYKLYKLYTRRMTQVTLSEFRNNQSDYIAAAQKQAVVITSRGKKRRAVVVSPDFYDRAIEALEDKEDLLAAKKARQEKGRVSHAELLDELDM